MFLVGLCENPGRKGVFTRKNRFSSPDVTFKVKLAVDIEPPSCLELLQSLKEKCLNRKGECRFLHLFP